VGEVASIAGSGNPVVTAADQRFRAERSFECARAEGVPVILDPFDGGQARARWEGSLVMFKTDEDSAGSETPEVPPRKMSP
jgi:hypothetical protein